MATLAATPTSRPVTPDHRFFLTMAIVIALINVAGFSVHLGMGRSTFAAPPLVHVHAVVFFGWVTIYVLQNALVAAGSIRLHRRLGWFAAAWGAMMVIVGITTVVTMTRAGRTPFFFEPNYFLVMDSLALAVFAGLTGWAIGLRRRTEWHRRLMLCGTAFIAAPAIGRLIPLPLLIPYAGWWVFGVVILLPIAGMVFDLRRRGSIHPAYLWGGGILTLAQVAMGVIAHSPPGLAIYAAITAGTPGAAVAPDAYPPPPPLP